MARKDNFWDLVVFPKFRDAYVYDDGEVKGILLLNCTRNKAARTVLPAIRY